MDRDRKKDRDRNRDIDRNRDTDQLLSVDTAGNTNHDRDVAKLNVLHGGPSSYLTDFPLVSVPCYPSSMTKNDETTLIFIRTAKLITARVFTEFCWYIFPLEFFTFKFSSELA